MTWTISHGRPNPGGMYDGYHSRSYGEVGEWRDALLSLPLSARDAAILRPLTQRRNGDPFTVEPRRAAAIAGILRQNLGRMPRGLREMTETLADAAERASAANQPWRWS
ncbi:hypothetical protein OG900_33190 [Streptomyces sp. NBC_00433]